MINIKELLIKNQIIAAIRNEEELKIVLNNKVKIVFILYGSLVDIENICEMLKTKNKIIFIHIDMLEGIKSDHKGLDFVKKAINPDGIITTKSSNIKYAAALGFYTIQRIFLIDSQSVITGVNNINSVKPSAVEVLPGIAYKTISTIKKETNLPIIAGGLINDFGDVKNALLAGAVAISTSKIALWEANIH